jgi:hypothetical protein
MTYAGPQAVPLHISRPCYGSKAALPKGKETPGWGLVDCEVEEYPWGSGNPNRTPNPKIWDEQLSMFLIASLEVSSCISERVTTLRCPC